MSSNAACVPSEWLSKFSFSSSSRCPAEGLGAGSAAPCSSPRRVVLRLSSVQPPPVEPVWVRSTSLVQQNKY